MIRQRSCLDKSNDCFGFPAGGATDIRDKVDFFISLFERFLFFKDKK